MKNKLNLFCTIIYFVFGAVWLTDPVDYVMATILFGAGIVSLMLFLVNTFIVDCDEKYQKHLEEEAEEK